MGSFLVELQTRPQAVLAGSCTQRTYRSEAFPLAPIFLTATPSWKRRCSKSACSGDSDDCDVLAVEDEDFLILAVGGVAERLLRGGRPREVVSVCTSRNGAVGDDESMAIRTSGSTTTHHSRVAQQCAPLQRKRLLCKSACVPTTYSSYLVRAECPVSTGARKPDCEHE